MHRNNLGKVLFTLTVALMAIGFQGRALSAPRAEGQQDDNQGVRLRARAQRMIRGIEAELRGDFRSGNGSQDNNGKRLNGELDNINLPRGTEISFCLATMNGSIPLAVRKLSGSDDDRKAVEFELNGGGAPDVMAGDKLESRKGGSGGKADCTAPLLISAKFHR
jgi:hypothetical protein